MPSLPSMTSYQRTLGACASHTHRSVAWEPGSACREHTTPTGVALGPKAPERMKKKPSKALKTLEKALQKQSNSLKFMLILGVFFVASLGPTLGMPWLCRKSQASSRRPPPQPWLRPSHCTRSSGARERPCSSSDHIFKHILFIIL